MGVPSSQFIVVAFLMLAICFGLAASHTSVPSSKAAFAFFSGFFTCGIVAVAACYLRLMLAFGEASRSTKKHKQHPESIQTPPTSRSPLTPRTPLTFFRRREDEDDDADDDAIDQQPRARTAIIKQLRPKA